MRTNNKAGNLSELGKLKILLPGIPSRSSRGWFGYCTVILFPLANRWALFDTGHYSDRALLLDSLEEQQIDPEAITAVVLSHLHFDHVLNLSIFKNATLIVSKAELDYAQMVSDGKIADPSIPDFWPALFKGKDVRLVDDALELEPGLELVNLPGHTPGCLAMFCDEGAGVAACGDVVKNGWEALTAEAGSPGSAIDKLRQNIKFIADRARVIIPGHDRPLTLRENGIEYLTDVSWQVQGNFYPRSRDEVLLNLEMKGGFCPKP